MIATARTWRSPVDGTPLRADTPHSLADETTRWPVVDGIAYLRVARDDLRARALRALDAGDRTTALTTLLQDRDDWARGTPPAAHDVRDLVDNVAVRSLRDAMALLAYGPVATYFAHRFSDPTFLAGLALLAAHRPPQARSFELGCGIGHYLRELDRAGVEATGADVVFSKLWLARHYVAPRANLLCFDAAAPWPMDDAFAPLVHCHDAFYFFANKPLVAREMHRVSGDAGTVLVGHAHNRRVDNYSAGDPLDARAYAKLLDARIAYDDAELTRAFVETRPPKPATPPELDAAAALAFVAGTGAERSAAMAANPTANDVATYPPGTRLRRNPLYGRQPDGTYRIAWPSERYEAEYAAIATYPPELDDAPGEVVAGTSLRDDERIRRRAYVALPARW